MRNMFIKLIMYSGQPVYVNISHIIDVYKSAMDEFTIINCLGHSNGGFRVKHTPEEVLEIINKEQKTWL